MTENSTALRDTMENTKALFDTVMTYVFPQVRGPLLLQIPHVFLIHPSSYQICSSKDR